MFSNVDYYPVPLFSHDPWVCTSRVNQLSVIDILHSLMISKTFDASNEAIEPTMEVTHRALNRQPQEKTVTKNKSR